MTRSEAVGWILAAGFALDVPEEGCTFAVALLLKGQELPMRMCKATASVAHRASELGRITFNERRLCIFVRRICRMVRKGPMQ